MATSVQGSCQSIVRCTAHTTRRVSRARAARLQAYATSTNQPVKRADETEELPAGFKMSNLSSLAHEELRTHRELRELARKAAWEMPLLSALSKPFEPPTQATPLRWRYTTYMGELHPAASKVVVEFCLGDLKNVTDAEKQTIRKLAGARWYSVTDIIKMSCESFETQAQNKRYLGETIAALIKEAKEGADKFEDVPLDMRVQAVRQKKRQKSLRHLTFPQEWKLTKTRRAELNALPGRELAQVEAPVTDDAEEQKAYEEFKRAAFEQGELVTEAASTGQRAISGAETIHATLGLNPRRESAIRDLAQQPLPQGKMGKREMGQQPVRR